MLDSLVIICLRSFISLHFFLALCASHYITASFFAVMLTVFMFTSFLLHPDNESFQHYIFPSPKIKMAHCIYLLYRVPSEYKKYYQNLSSVSCERRIRTPVLQLMRLVSYHCSTSLCVPHTRHVVSDLRLCGLRTFTANQ